MSAILIRFAALTAVTASVAEFMERRCRRLFVDVAPFGSEEES